MIDRNGVVVAMYADTDSPIDVYQQGWFGVDEVCRWQGQSYYRIEYDMYRCDDMLATVTNWTEREILSEDMGQCIKRLFWLLEKGMKFNPSYTVPLIRDHLMGIMHHGTIRELFMQFVTPYCRRDWRPRMEGWLDVGDEDDVVTHVEGDTVDNPIDLTLDDFDAAFVLSDGFDMELNIDDVNAVLGDFTSELNEMEE